MSDVSAVHTQITKSSSGNAPQQDKANAAISGTPNLNFFDFLITKVTSDHATINDPKVISNPATAGDPTTTTDLSIAPDQNIPVDPTAVTDATGVTPGDTSPGLAFDLTGNGGTTVLDAAGLKILKEALNNLLHGLPADQKPVAMTLTDTQLQKILQDIKANASTLQNGQQALIATGLTPEQLTKLSDLIAQASISDNPTGLQAILVGILTLVPDEQKAQTIFLPKTLMVAQGEKPKSNAKTEDLTSSLTALIGNTLSANTSAVKEGGLDSGAIAPEKKAAGGFNEVLRLLENIQAGDAQTVNAAPSALDTTITGQNAAPAQAGPVNSTTGASFDSILGTFSSGESLDSLFPEGLSWSKDNQFGLSNLQVSNPAQLTSLITQTSAASQPHPATQVVAATLARAFEGGETKSMTLRLDPPELGKIEIQMQFTKDKSVKTHMIFEKPETMLMMQRDAHTLERAMQAVGMDSGGNSLSFELASQDNNAFNGGNGSNDNAGGNTSSGSAEPQIIETTMSWSVDAQTGQYHYNVLV